MSAELVARAVRICTDAQVMDFNGHVSCRDDADPNVVWINNRKASRATLTVADIVPYDIAAAKRIGEGEDAPLEHWIHREIYLRRPEVRAIVHSHPKFILSLSVSRTPLAPAGAVGSFLPEEGAPVFDSPVLINSLERGTAMANALGSAPALVLRQHGTVTVGRSIPEAAVRMICAEANAEILHYAMQHGDVHLLRGGELKTLAAENWSNAAIEKYWHHHEECAQRRGALDQLTLA
jgi:ribulose-5-phosphate 4-epimerase/fuculose-1-phosphate aldolase